VKNNLNTIYFNLLHQKRIIIENTIANTEVIDLRNLSFADLIDQCKNENNFGASLIETSRVWLFLAVIFSVFRAILIEMYRVWLFTVIFRFSVRIGAISSCAKLPPNVRLFPSPV